jgi:hypothetical protein
LKAPKDQSTHAPEIGAAICGAVCDRWLWTSGKKWPKAIRPLQELKVWGAECPILLVTSYLVQFYLDKWTLFDVDKWISYLVQFYLDK